ncbi:MAG: hypothetical protein EG822_07815 [Deltaproteobacteria bacterium]|nr:hypothetical protein [Deltaproteobacteria bacterium]TLN04677.1 MAG: hypothetical protein FDZ73_02835 [bacterium]
MKILSSIFIVPLLFASLAAAASAPSFETLSKLPVVRFGDPLPASDFILLFSAGQPITMSITIEGSLFSQPAKNELTVIPAREIFVYRDWASLDGLVWMQRSDLITSDVVVKIPGYNHPLPGVLKVRMDLPATR